MRHYDILFPTYQEGVEYYKKLGFKLTQEFRLVKNSKEAVITNKNGQYFGYIKSLSDES